jgi:hypothetical protein
LSGVEGFQDSANKLCMFVHLTLHSVFVLSNTIFNIIRVVTVQTFTVVSSTFGIQNGVVKFNSNQCYKNWELSFGYCIRDVKINMTAYLGLSMISDETLKLEM